MIKKTRGFTLVELLVVVAIIGILATVVSMNVLGAQKKARFNTALSNFNDALRAASACVSDEGTLNLPASAPYNQTNLSALASMCSGSTVATMKWPTMPASPAGYAYTVTMTSSGVTAATFAYPSGESTGTVTCSATSCTK